MSDFLATKCIDLQTIGGGGGGSFSSYKEDGSLISRIEAWADDNRMRGIKVYYSNSKDGYSYNDQGFMFGKTGGTKYEYTFTPGEIITSLSIWNTKWDGHTFVGAFKFTTSLGKTFYPKEKTSSHKEYVMKYGYGAMVGIAGRSGNALDSLGFYFIKEAKKVRLSDVVYDESSLPTPIANNIVNMPYTNNSDVEQTYEYQYSYTAYREKSWMMSSGFEESYSLTISAEVPVLEATVGAEASASWTYTQETSNTSTYSYSQEVATTYPVVVPPHTQVDLDMTYFSGKCDISYYGKVTLTLDNNQTFYYYTTGTYAGGNTTQVTSTLTSTPVNANGKTYGQSDVSVDFVDYQKMAA
jgi:hypothetical protein